MTGDTGAGRGANLVARLAQLRTELVYAVQDVALCGISFAAVLLFRFDGLVPTDRWWGYLTFLPVAVLTFVTLQWSSGLYGHVWQYASVSEARRLLFAGGAAAAVLGVFTFVSGRPVPLSVAVLGSVVTTMVIGAARFQSRLVSARRVIHERSLPHASAVSNVVIIGTGRSAATLIRQMLAGGTGMTPVGILDDDVRLRGRMVQGVRVLGSPDVLPAVTRTLDVHQAILAVPDAPRDVVRHVADLADRAGVSLRVLPDEGDLLRNGVRLQDVRDVRIDDLLGREPIPTDLEAVSHLLAGRRVLITGAGGSIGSEIARQVARCVPAALVLLDHDETHLHDAQATIHREAISVLADIRDADQMLRVFAKHLPEVVFHAAAHKHVPILEDAPAEAVRTNVMGTRNVVRAARSVAVDLFILISTDKAVHPSSVMGASKRIAERVVLSAGSGYTAVRFGNVLGSRGSVIPTFVRQIQWGGPVTVTDPAMTRYFMTIPEAVQLVLEAAAMSEGGEVFMLDMGDPVSIVDLATRMIRLSGRRPGRDIEIRFTGMRPGEKLVEELHQPEEAPKGTGHPSVFRLRPSACATEALDETLAVLADLAGDGDDPRLRQLVLDTAWSLGRVQPVTGLVPRQGVLDPSGAGDDRTTNDELRTTVDLRGSATWSPSTT